MVDIRLLKCSGADLILNGRQLKQYLPKGVMNVVRSPDFVDSGI